MQALSHYVAAEVCANISLRLHEKDEATSRASAEDSTNIKKASDEQLEVFKKGIKKLVAKEDRKGILAPE